MNEQEFNNAIEDNLQIAIVCIFAIMLILGFIHMAIYMAHYKNRICYKQNQEIINQAISNPELAENLLKLVKDCSDVDNKQL